MGDSHYGKNQEQQAIWVFLEHDNKVLADVTREILSKGRQLADETGWHLAGLLMGREIWPLAQEAIACGADEIILVDHPLLDPFTIEAHTHAANQLIRQHAPSILLVGATPNGRDLAGRLAVRLRTGLNADCTDLRVDPERGVLVSEVSGFGGGVLALIEMPQHRPQMATVRPGVFPAQEPDLDRAGIISSVIVEIPPEIIQTRLVERSVGQGLDLSQAPVLVVGGRGVDGDFEPLHRLAHLLGGDVGATRPAVDEGYVERERQIGQTGVVCRPTVALVCGASGAFQFIVGIRQAELILAINADPEAPIFDESDYCVVADLHQILPALIQELQNDATLAPMIPPLTEPSRG